MDTVVQALEKWSAEAFAIVHAEVMENLHGRVLNRRTGRLSDSIAIVSRVFSNGFEIGTNVNYGIAWEFGFDRKAFAVNPVRARALHWMEGGRDIFAKYAFIPEQHFEARPWLRPAFDDKMETVMDRLTARMDAALESSI